MGADSCGLPSPRSRVPPAQGRPDGPDAVSTRPVGVAVPLLAGARSPALAPSATQPSAPGRFTDPPELPREGRYPSGMSPRSPGHDRGDTGRPKGAPSGREGRERSVGAKRGAPTEAARSHQLSLLSLLFTCCGQRRGTGSILVKSQARRLNRGSNPGLHSGFKNKRLKSQLRGS